jgi:hypothetical protein
MLHATPKWLPVRLFSCIRQVAKDKISSSEIICWNMTSYIFTTQDHLHEDANGHKLISYHSEEKPKSQD